MFTQFQGAFSDNAFKTLVVFLIIGSEASSGGRDQVLLIGAVFAVPFLLFSMAGGYLADRYSKRSVTIATKILEIGVMTLGLVGLSLDILWIKVAAVFLMSVQSALFGPSKYGILPEMLPERKLSWGNGLLQLGTFMAIILGTVGGGWMSESFRAQHALSGLAFVGLGCLGLLTALGIERLPAANPQRAFQLNFLGDLWVQIRRICRDRVLYLAVVGHTFFFFLAPLLQFNILFYAIEVLQVSETQNSLLQAAVAVGIGSGSVAAGYLSGGKIEYGLVPLGAVGMCIFSGLLFFPGLSYVQAAAFLALVGFFAGFFVVPIYALIQHRPSKKHAGGIIAAANLLSMVGVFLASVSYYLLAQMLGLDTYDIFLAGSLMTLGATVYLLVLLPDSLLRFLLWALTHSVYRIGVEGRDHIPEKGGALFVCNHLSFVDALLLIASTDRPIRFLMYKGYYDLPVVRPLAKVMGVIPIAGHQSPRDLMNSLRTARDAIRGGEVVGVFAEGQITRTGQLLPFRRGLERIMKGVQAPIVPVHLDGVWGSLFSFERGRFLWKLPRRWLQKVTVRFGPPLSSSTPAHQIRNAVQKLDAESSLARGNSLRPLHRSFVSRARRRPWRLAMADDQTGRLRFGPALCRALLLARRLRVGWAGQEKVGLLMRPSVGAVLLNWAAFLSGKVPVNLDCDASQDTLDDCIRRCGLRTVVAPSDWNDRGLSARILIWEEMSRNPGLLERMTAIAWAALLPVRWLERLLGRRRAIGMDDLATVAFSRGSGGASKGVLLTHSNLASNVEQLARILFLRRRDRVLGVLPLSHPFGFTGTAVLPGVLGIGAVYQTNPRNAASAGALAKKYSVTILPATPAQLEALVACPPGHFGSLEYVLSAGEKLPPEIEAAFEDRFGIRPLEAYGAAECSPAVSVSTRDFRARGVRQAGSKRGKMGQPLPGISVRIVDPAGREPLPANESGLLQVRGPNVMAAYLEGPEATAEVLRDGWFSTGDLATLDEDGFLEILGRVGSVPTSTESA